MVEMMMEVLLLVVIVNASDHVVRHSLRDFIFWAVLTSREISSVFLNWVSHRDVNRGVEFLLKVINIFFLHKHIHFHKWIFTLSFGILLVLLKVMSRFLSTECASTQARVSLHRMVQIVFVSFTKEDLLVSQGLLVDFIKAVVVLIFRTQVSHYLIIDDLVCVRILCF